MVPINVDLCDDDIKLITGDGKTVLLPMSGVPDVRIEADGTPLEWSESDWRNFENRASFLDDYYPGFTRELKHVRESIGRRQMNEVKVINEDDENPPEFRVLHTLEVRHSKRGDCILVRRGDWGSGTYRNREGLSGLGLKWNPELRAWMTGFSPDKLGEVIEFVRKHDERTPRDDSQGGIKTHIITG